MDFWMSMLETAPQTLHDSLAVKGGETFTFSPGGKMLIEDDNLPPGTLQIDVAASFTEAGVQTYAMAIKTSTPLTIDPSCLSTITGGVVTITFGGNTSAVETISWTGCGTYGVSHS